MLFTVIATVACLEPLSVDRSEYINYESAVNPEYYDRTTRQTKKSDYGEPIVHRKLGLSTPNEKIVYQTWLTKELRTIVEFLDDFVCLKEKMCGKQGGFRSYLFKLRGLNEIKQERFLNAISEREFKSACRNAVEIYDKFFDIGYCNFAQLKVLRKHLSSLLELIDNENLSKIANIVDLLIWTTDEIQKYETECK